uniref:small integral membrane protein 35-like n=1 Tax=Pristiophorus japonicus TaxID=55135 RepID=UPI00398F52E4
MDNPHEEQTTITPLGEVLPRIQRQIAFGNNTGTEGGSNVNTRGIIIAICLLLLAIAMLTILFVQYRRHGRCFQKPRLMFGRNVLRNLKSIQLEFDPPFTVSGMMNTAGNRSSDRAFQYRNMRARDEDFYPSVEEHH